MICHVLPGNRPSGLAHHLDLVMCDVDTSTPLRPRFTRPRRSGSRIRLERVAPPPTVDVHDFAGDEVREG